jgi:hypothetical protein
MFFISSIFTFLPLFHYNFKNPTNQPYPAASSDLRSGGVWTLRNESRLCSFFIVAENKSVDIIKGPPGNFDKFDMNYGAYRARPVGTQNLAQNG